MSEKKRKVSPSGSGKKKQRIPEDQLLDFKTSVLYINSTVSSKDLMEAGFQTVKDSSKGSKKDKLERVMERIVDGAKFPELEKLRSEKINWRKILSPNTLHDIRMRPKHFCEGCPAGCSKMMEDKEVTYASMVHAEYAKQYWKTKWAFQFCKESGSLISQRVTNARSAAEQGKLADKEKGEKKVVRPDDAKPDPEFKKLVQQDWNTFVVQTLCEQDPLFKRCLLATKDAVLIDGKVVLQSLMDARERVAAGFPVGSIVRAEVSDPIKYAFPVNVFFKDGGFASFPPGVLTLPEENCLATKSDGHVQLLERLKRERPRCFASYDSYVPVVICPPGEKHFGHQILY
jgi:hypothetical protein